MLVIILVAVNSASARSHHTHKIHQPKHAKTGPVWISSKS